MKILEAFGEPVSYGGQEIFVMNVLDHMDRSGMEIDFLTPYFCDNESIRSRVMEYGGIVYELGCSFRPGRSRMDTALPILEFLRKRNYDLIHIHSGSSSMLAIYAAASHTAGIECIIAHSHCTGRDDMRHTVSRAATVPVLKRCVTDFCACSEESGRWRFPRSVCDSELHVIKNGIDTAAFAYDEQKRAEIRSMYGIVDDTVLIGTVGRLTYQKNQLYMLRLLRKMISDISCPDCDDDHEKIREIHETGGKEIETPCGSKAVRKYMLMFAGGGEDLEMLQTYAMMMGLQDRVIFAGVSGRISDFYSAIDVLAVPSEYEGFPLVVLEAQAAGLEVIASEAVPRIAEETGLVRIIPLEDRDEWIAALTSDHCRHSGTARKLEEMGYSAVKTAELIRKLYLQNIIL